MQFGPTRATGVQLGKLAVCEVRRGLGSPLPAKSGSGYVSKGDEGRRTAPRTKADRRVVRPLRRRHGCVRVPRFLRVSSVASGSTAPSTTTTP